jgi:response regulator of citrate/malate metabolism
MALDASIYGRFQPKSAASYAAEFEQLAGMREQRQDNALARAFRQEQMGQARAQAERGNALRALQQGLDGKSDEEVVQRMRAAGFVDEAATYETGALERQIKRNTVRGPAKLRPSRPRPTHSLAR